MDAQPAGSFDRKAFIAAVKAAIEAKSPTTLEEADEYQESGRAGEVKSDVKGLVGGNKSQAAERIETATEAPPDTSKAVPKTVAPLPQEDAGKAATIPAAGAVPKPAPPEQLNLAAGKVQADQELADGGVTEEQLARSNEPEFTGALAAKQEAARHADTAPAQFRQVEATTLTQTRTEADATTAAATTGMHGSRAAALAQVMGQKAETKSRDETRRAEVSAKVRSIFAATEADVKKILDGIDPKVDKEFETGEKAARTRFEAFVEAKMSAYKKDRYGGWLGGYRWLRDKIVGMPPAVNEFFVAGRELYLKEMDGVIARVADVVGTDLNAAKARIAAGKAQIAAYVKGLPEDLRKVGAEAATAVGDQFEQLESDVTAKQEALVDSLATKYVESRKVLDDRIEELQAENAGLVDKAIGAIKGVIGTILKLKDMLLGVLGRAAGAVTAIIRDPIGFLGKFVNAIKAGIQNFAGNILEHLKKGLQAWLFGALAQGGVELPETFDLKGVLKLVGSIFGLTWANIRSRIVAKIGAGVMGKIESGFEIVKLLMTEGLGGLWRVVQEKVGDLKEMVVTQIQDMVVTQIVKAGITWLISMLNPAGAFIKACKMIYDVVMFFVEKADQIKEFVDSVLDSVESILGGGVGAVAAKIEQTLAKMVPVLIGFLASLLGLGGISEKVKKAIETVQKPVNKSIDWVIGKAVHYGKRFLGSVKDRVKGAAKKLGTKVKKTLGIKDKTPEEIARDKQQRLEKGVAAGVAAADRFAGRSVAGRLLSPVLAVIRLRYRMTTLDVVPEGGTWSVRGEVNPTLTRPTKAAPPDPELVEAQGYVGQAVDLVDAKQVPSRGTVASVDPTAKLVNFKTSARRDIGGRKVVVAGVQHATLKDFLTAVRAKQPIAVQDLGALQHDSRWVMNVNGKFVLTPEAKDGWRKRFYGDYSAARKKWKKDMLKQPFTGDPKDGLAHPDDVKLKIHVTNRRFWSRGNFYNPTHGKRFEPTIDHDPPVVQNWNEEGRFTVQGPRKDFFSAGDLEILPWFLNSSEGSGGVSMVDEVGPDFRGPKDKQ
jgi:hypothetical protein